MVDSKVTKNFESYAQAEAYLDGIKVLSGIIGIHTQVVLSPILPLETKGYTVTITLTEE
jgi:hypothetical protein